MFGQEGKVTMKKVINLSFEDAVLDMKHLIEERGEDYVYPFYRGKGTCYYFEDDGQPSCAVGGILARHGVTAQDMDYWSMNESSVADLIRPSWDYAKEEHVDPPIHLDVDHKTADYLRQLQGNQDSGMSWGEAHDAAMRFVQDY